jgi:cytochrome c-type biogenesis protein CcmF
MSGEVSDSWIRSTRRWTLVGWLFLGLGLILGGWWAYDVLGWGGYWGWDPVENAALLPWLTATPFLHSVMIEEKRGMLRRWNMFLIILTYLLVVLGTFATRSGFVASVHSFAQSAIGPLFSLFLAGALIISTKLLIDRWDSLKADHELDSLISRESFFLAQNLLFLTLAFTVALGTYWPVVTELLSTVRGLGVEKASLGPEWYNTVTAPQWLAIVFLMGIAPLAAWHRASLKRIGRAMIYPAAVAAVLTVIAFLLGARSPYALLAYALVFLSGLVTLFEYHRGAYARVGAHGESYPKALWSLFGRNRRRYGGYMIHLGVVIMAIGVVGSNAFQQETQRQLAVGGTMELGGYILEYESMDPFVATDGREVYKANTVVYTSDGREVARLFPRNDEFFTSNNQIQPMTIPAKYTTWTGDDFYVLLAAREPVPGQSLRMMNATFKIYYNPLVNWVWGGGFVFILGTVIAAWPDFSEERRTVTEAEARRARPLRHAPAAGD